MLPTTTKLTSRVSWCTIGRLPINNTVPRVLPSVPKPNIPPALIRAPGTISGIGNTRAIRTHIVAVFESMQDRRAKRFHGHSISQV